jgi:hypothetical protein
MVNEFFRAEDRTMKKMNVLTMITLVFGLALPLAAAPTPKPLDTSKPPEKLSDLYKVFTLALRDGLGADVQAWPVRIVGRSWELVRDGKFPEVELTLKPFHAQDLSFEKAEILFKKMTVDHDALVDWKIKLIEVREVESRLIFSMRSLSQKLGKALGQDVTLKADAEEQTVLLTQQGHYLFIPCTVESTCELNWDDAVKKLTMVPKSVRYGGHIIWRWFWWLGSRPVPQAPILDLGFSWIPFNIQEVHVSWDRVNLTTNW